ncbi:uncharacterized protein LOC118002204 [Mirounga leonina]|uniref:uncharacterized protein LOC118002204 n=1 Tax=Mirounga leonina TaxID=9715 RepID=UPI00156C3AF1|nr:uncharacterized protein LOC118002204 [Mirounga leonina]
MGGWRVNLSGAQRTSASDKCRSAHSERRLSSFCPQTSGSFRTQCIRVGLQKHFLWRGFSPTQKGAWHLVSSGIFWLKYGHWRVPQPQPSQNAAEGGPFRPGGQPTFFLRPTHRLPHVLSTPPLSLAGLQAERDAPARTSALTCPAPAPSVCETSASGWERALTTQNSFTNGLVLSFSSRGPQISLPESSAYSDLAGSTVPQEAGGRLLRRRAGRRSPGSQGSRAPGVSNQAEEKGECCHCSQDLGSLRTAPERRR